MTQKMTRVVKEEEVSTEVLRIIREARQFVVLVSPFNSFWTHLKNAIQEAVQRGVRVTLIYQGDSYARGDGTEWLLAQGGAVYRNPNLHAKMYLNESFAMLSSMNLTQGSSRNSMDIGIVVHGTEGAYQDVYAYAKRLASLSTRIDAESEQSMSGGSQPQSPASSAPTPLRDTVVRRSNELSKSAFKAVRAWVTRGRCIRCQKIIPYDTGNPFCRADYEVWNRFKNQDYIEKFCHRCGVATPTTYAKPVCASCS